MAIPVQQQITAKLSPVPLSVTAGQTITLSFLCLDPANGNAPIDLTGKTVEFCVRAIQGFLNAVTGPALIAHLCALAMDPTTGVCTLTLTVNDTLALVGEYAWDLTLVGTGSPGARTPLIPISRFYVTNTVGLPTDTYT